MNPKLKPLILFLGLLATILIISQLVMGLLIVKGGGSFDINKLVKAHQHSGYLTVTMVLVYIVTSVVVLLRVPTRSN